MGCEQGAAGGFLTVWGGTLLTPAVSQSEIDTGLVGRVSGKIGSMFKSEKRLEEVVMGKSALAEGGTQSHLKIQLQNNGALFFLALWELSLVGGLRLIVCHLSVVSLNSSESVW